MWEFHLSNNVIACDSAASNLTAQNLQPLTLKLRFFRRWLRNFLQWLQVLFMTMKRRLCLLQRRLSPAEETVPPAEETVPPAERTCRIQVSCWSCQSSRSCRDSRSCSCQSSGEATWKFWNFRSFWRCCTSEATKGAQGEDYCWHRRKTCANCCKSRKWKDGPTRCVAPSSSRGERNSWRASAQAPFNAFGGKDSAQLAVKEEVDSSEENDLCVQDLRLCQVCKTKSYIRQGLCINIYCKLYYMGRADSGTSMCPR